MGTYELAGALLDKYLDAYQATTDDRKLTSYELISLERERQLRPRITISRERLEQESRGRIPAGRL